MSFTQPTIKGTRSPNAPQFFLGRVKNIVLSSSNIDGTPNPDYLSSVDVGKIKYELIHNSGLGHYLSDSNTAYPIFSSIRQYPVIGEIVMLVKGPSIDMNEDAAAQTTYYFPPYNIWNSANHNIFPNMAEYAQFIKDNYNDLDVSDYSKIDYPKGYYFEEDDIRKIKPYEGDTIIEGRFGQSIRFGSSNIASQKESVWASDKKGPITIIRNGQGKFIKTTNFIDEDIVENPNSEGSFICMTSGQNVILEGLNEFSFESYGISQTVQIDRTIEKIQTVDVLTDSISPREYDKS